MTRLMAGFAAFALTSVPGAPGLRSTVRRSMERFNLYIDADERKRTDTPEPWKIVIPMAACVVALIYVVFDQLLAIPWQPTLAGMLFPVLHAIPSV